MNSKYQSAGELIDFSIGGGWGKEEPAADYSNKVAIVRGADFPDVDNGIFDRIPVRWEKETKATKASLKAGDVILEISGGTDERPTGRTVRVSQELLDSFDCPVIPASFCRLVRPNEYVNSQYFYYWLQDMYAKGRTWNYQNRSTGLSNFQFKVFCEAEEVRVPSYNEQCAIAEVLCLIDKKRMANIKLNDYLLELIEAVFRSWFIGENALYPTSRLPMSEIALISAGGDKPAVCQQTPSAECSVPIYSNGTDNEGLYGYTDAAKIIEPSVTVSARGTIGFTCLRYQPYYPIVRLISATPKEKVTAEYLYLWLRGTVVTGVGTTQQQLTVPMFKNYEVNVPDAGSLDAFMKIATPLFALIDANKSEMAELAELRDALLPKLMSGEIDISRVEL